jgi:hypothetical protein
MREHRQSNVVWIRGVGARLIDWKKKIGNNT